MAIINLLPTAVKRPKHAAVEKKIAKPLSIPKVPFLGPFIIILILLLFGIWIFLSIQIKIKEKSLISLKQKVQNLKSVYKITDELTQKKKELDETISLYGGLLENNIIWSQKLSLINEFIPVQIWLVSLSIETKTSRVKVTTTKQAKPEVTITRTLVIRGSATSLMGAEIINSITQFIERLKQDIDFSKDFEEIKLGPLESETKSNFNVMNFILYCKFK